MMERLGMGHVLSRRIGRCFKPDNALPDISKRFEKRLLRLIQQGNMQMVSFAINGLQGSGKTEYAKYWMWRIEQHYQNLTWTIWTDNLDIAIEEAKKIPPWVRVVTIVLDDAMSYQSSYSTQADEEKAKKWFLLRHIIEEIIGLTGIIFAFLIWQRYNSVNANFRNVSGAYAFLTPMTDKTDAQKIRSMIGNISYEALRSEYAERQVSDVRKSRVIVHIPSTSEQNAGWHIYLYIPEHNPDWKCPEFLETRKYFLPKVKKTDEEILNELASIPKYERDVAVYRRILSKESQQSIAADMGIGQSTVSDIRARVTKILADGGLP